MSDRDVEAAVSCCCLLTIVTILTLFYTISLSTLKTPTVKIECVTVQNLAHGNSSSPFFNTALGAKFVVKNPNIFYKFYFDNNMVTFYYGSEVVGNAEISRGKAKTRRSKTRDVVTNVKYYGGSESDMLNLTRDIELGFLELNCGARVEGYFPIYRDRYTTIKKRRTAVLNCVVSLDLNNGVVKSYGCK